jgi:hypothetical protein
MMIQVFPSVLEIWLKIELLLNPDRAFGLTLLCLFVFRSPRLDVILQMIWPPWNFLNRCPGEIFPDPSFLVRDVITLFTALFWLIFTIGQTTKSDNLNHPFF